MAPARSKKVADEDIQLSQISNEDEDAGSATLIQLLQKYKAQTPTSADDQARSRKKKEAEFLRKAKLAFENTVTEHAKAIADSMNEIHDIYVKFQEEHAATNDRIRNAWVAIYTEQQRCKACESGSELVEKIAQVDRVAGEEADERMEKQLSALKQCIIEERHCIEMLHASRIPT
ncbi:hypothetical protein M407DRAFT_21425 [Tulasnella calospora MUT 4182]|uniref:Uncharacterized protein n=1 Tax=Tulasnella calospora MUT 4182 TaxID=1051891 RepID=A0A0C3QEE0_9AGAM|nr:hypothetical protein M407DRAFT_21425 [Tulasnella calospora MUT 4182]